MTHCKSFKLPLKSGFDLQHEDIQQNFIITWGVAWDSRLIHHDVKSTLVNCDDAQLNMEACKPFLLEIWRSCGSRGFFVCN